MKKSAFYTLLAMAFLVASACGDEHVSSGDNFEVIDLPDNSTIYMNKGCDVWYEKNFVENRKVKLTGEAYFDIAKGDNPFTIEAGPGQITVTGTRLNVKADGDDLDVEVDEGEVEVEVEGERKIARRGDRISFGNKTFSIGKATRDFRKWLGQLERDLDKLGRKVGKDLEKGSSKAEKKIKKIFN